MCEAHQPGKVAGLQKAGRGDEESGRSPFVLIRAMQWRQLKKQHPGLQGVVACMQVRGSPHSRLIGCSIGGVWVGLRQPTVLRGCHLQLLLVGGGVAGRCQHTQWR